MQSESTYLDRINDRLDEIEDEIPQVLGAARAGRMPLDEAARLLRNINRRLDRTIVTLDALEARVCV